MVIVPMSSKPTFSSRLTKNIIRQETKVMTVSIVANIFIINFRKLNYIIGCCLLKHLPLLSLRYCLSFLSLQYLKVKLSVIFG